MQKGANHKGIMQLHQDAYQNFPQEQPNAYMPLDQFEAYVSWLRDRFYYSGSKSSK